MDADTLTRTKDLIEKYEGRRHFAAADGEHRPVVGVGFDLERPDARQRIEALGLDFGAVRSGRIALSDAQIDALFDGDVRKAAAEARQQLAGFDDLAPDRQAAVTDMMFNLGADGFSEFRKMAGGIERPDWRLAPGSAKKPRTVILDDEDS